MITQEYWKDIRPIFNAIINHNFNKSLADGSLERSRFTFYIQQDTLYLKDFAKALNILKDKAPKKYVKDFETFAEGAVIAEQALHQRILKEFDCKAVTSKSPTCNHYTSYLLSQCSLKSFEVGVATVLPCFWIYAEVGKQIHEKSTFPNAYQAWIDTYAGDDFNEKVERILEITDEILSKASDDVQQEAKAAFRMATELELKFWQSAWDKEEWQFSQEVELTEA